MSSEEVGQELIADEDIRLDAGQHEMGLEAESGTGGSRRSCFSSASAASVWLLEGIEWLSGSFGIVASSDQFSTTPTELAFAVVLPRGVKGEVVCWHNPQKAMNRGKNLKNRVLMN